MPAAEIPEKPGLDPAFVRHLVRTFEDSQEHGVHLLFNEWWPHAPDAVVEGYVACFHAAPGAAEFLAARHFAEPVRLDTLAAMPSGSIGRCYHDFLVSNGLEKNLATNYRMLHDFMGASGRLERMPADLQYAVIRGFQIHDLLHVVTGYSSSPLDELALQAFCLAQLQFPYFGMWMATATSHATFLRPEAIVPVMDAITHGWQHGRACRNLQFERWEAEFERPVAEVRADYGLPAAGVRPPMAASRPIA
jgi:ubiquinone biosynthesis protein Coq4